MSLSVQIGLLFALATAVTSIVGFLLKYRGADESPAVTLRNPIKTSLALFSSRWYTIGIIVATASWGLHVAALALAPISIVQSVIAVTSASANLCTIAAGPVVFGEPLPSDQFQLVLRLLAFVLVIGASALTPPPVGSRGDGPPATATSSATTG